MQKHNYVSPRSSEEEAEYYFQKGRNFDYEKRFEEAIFSYNKAINLAPRNANYYYNKGLSFYNLEKFTESIDPFKKAIDLDPRNPVFYVGLGLSKLNLKRFSESINYFDKAIDINPSNYKYHYYKAECLFEMGDYVNAIKCYRLFNDNDGKISNSHYKMSIALSRLNNFEDAFKSINKALEIDPIISKYKLEKGNILIKLKRYKEALDNFSITNSPNYISYEKTIDCLCHLRRYDEALQIIIDSFDIANDSELKSLKKYLKIIHESEIFRKNNKNTFENKLLRFKRIANEEIFFEPTKKPRNFLIDFDEFKNDYTNSLSKVSSIKNEINELDQKLKEIKLEYHRLIDSEIPMGNLKIKSNKILEELEKINSLKQNKNKEICHEEKNLENFNSIKNNFISWINQHFRNTNDDCIICFDKPREVILAPCGHKIICKNCLFMGLSNCPYCKKGIESSIDKIIDVN